MADRSLAEKAYDYIYKQLATGSLRPGHRLVNRALADEIGVSVIPVREAIHRLASKGMVNYVPGSGAFVPDRSLKNIRELYVLRDALEGCAAEEAARYITDDQLESLEETLDRMREIQQQIARRRTQVATASLFSSWLDNEELFHSILVESSRNDLLTKVIQEHRAVSRVFDLQRNDPSILTLEVASATCQDRLMLLQALRERDPQQSRNLMSEQIRKGRQTVMRHLSARQEAHSHVTVPVAH